MIIADITLHELLLDLPPPQTIRELFELLPKTLIAIRHKRYAVLLNGPNDYAAKLVHVQPIQLSDGSVIEVGFADWQKLLDNTKQVSRKLGKRVTIATLP